ncbi:MAG: hypothetical protein ACYTGN_17680 [Planctomycetota bacterium]|jgi:hypothetical protein
MGRKNHPFPLEQFDSAMRFDVYFESAQRLVAMRNVRILGLKTWEQFEEPDEASDTFIALQDADDKVVFLEAAAVTMLAEAGTAVTLDTVSL